MDEFDAYSRIYVDTNVFIYFIEGSGEAHAAAHSFFARAGALRCRLYTNELTACECVYKPFRDGDLSRVALYDQLFAVGAGIETIPFNGAIARLAARYGGALGLKLVDAIHYMSALEAGCDAFATADSGFRDGPAMRVLRI